MPRPRLSVLTARPVNTVTPEVLLLLRATVKPATIVRLAPTKPLRLSVLLAPTVPKAPLLILCALQALTSPMKCNRAASLAP